jgi:hypothetical protein
VISNKALFVGFPRGNLPFVAYDLSCPFSERFPRIFHGPTSNDTLMSAVENRWTGRSLNQRDSRPCTHKFGFMSASPHKATEIVRRREMTRRANRRHMQCSKLAAYSITSSASVSKLSEMLRPRALAVFKLMTSSNLVG